jgi:hypothetical protein
MRILFLGAVLISGAAIAQTSATELGSLRDFKEFNEALCTRSIKAIASRPEFDGVRSAREIDVPKACACATDEVLRDSWLQTQMTGSESDIAERLKSSRLGSYFAVRVAAAALMCLTMEMEESLKAARSQQ